MNEDSSVSLSEDQYERLLEMWGPSTYGRNMYMAHRGRGALDVVALTAALDDVIARQEALRSSFARDAQALAKRVHPHVGVTIEVRDVDVAVLDDAMAEVIERHIPVDVAPLLRATLLRFAGDEWALVIVVHHLVFDAGSFGIFFGDLATAYRARRDGAAPAFAPLRASPADFARYQRERFIADADGLRAYFDERIGRCTPIDGELRARSGTPGDARRAGRVLMPFSFDPAQTSALRAACAQQRTSLVTVACAAFAALLARHSGRTDVTFMLLHNLRSDFDMAHRTQKLSLEGTIGHFPNSLVFHVEVAPGESGRELLQRTRAEMMDIAAHALIPIPLLDLGYLRKLPSLFAVSFNYQRERVKLELPGVTLERVPRERVESERWRFHQILECRLIESDTLNGYLIFDAGIFERKFVATLADELVHTLRRLANTPEEAVG